MKDIKDFANIKELYIRIADAFDMEESEIIFCTLNTPKIDMSRLLGGYIGLDDFIYAHIKGQTKTICLAKVEQSLGLTITDNGTGNPFVKRIKESSICSSADICIGDMIASINGQEVIKSRHYEVARILKDIPCSKEFSLILIEPKKAFAVAPRGSISNTKPVSKLLEYEMDDDDGEERVPTLRLKSDGEAVLEDSVSHWMLAAVDAVDDTLEAFMGIRDIQLASTMVELSRDKTSVHEFSRAINASILCEFQFPDDFLSEVWSVINSTHKKTHRSVVDN
jgi:hypothetical protein